jgi:hypothetical protein
VKCQVPCFFLIRGWSFLIRGWYYLDSERNESGILPVKEFPAKPAASKLARRPIVSGRVPVKLLFLKSNYPIRYGEKNDTTGMSGKVPLSMFSARPNDPSDSNRNAGKVPVNMFLSKNK